MARIVKVAADQTPFDQAITGIQKDDVLLLSPGEYFLPGLDLGDVVLKGTGSSPEMTVLKGNLLLLGRYFTLENLTLEGEEAIEVLNQDNPYLSLRNCIIKSSQTGIIAHGDLNFESYSCRFEGGGLDLAEGGAKFAQISDTTFTGKTAIRADGSGQLNLSGVVGQDFKLDQGDFLLYFDQVSASEVYLGSSTLEAAESSFKILSTVHGDIHVLNSRSDLVQIVSGQGNLLNSRMDLFQAMFSDCQLTNCHVDEVKANGSSRLSLIRTFFKMDLELAGKAQVQLADCLLEDSHAQLTVRDSAGIRGNFLAEADQVLEVKDATEGLVKITGIKSKLV